MSLGPEDYIPILKRFGVTAVVRLNKKVYDRKKFLDAGIKHYDMYFIDGGNPTDAILKQYLDVVEGEKGAIGIHCKAGLGRTGVLNAAFLMKHYRLSANELIAWMRICRPGTVIGPQQQFLKEIEPKMWKEGDLWRQQNGNQPPVGAADLPPVPEGWFEQPEARCDQDEDMVAAQGGHGRAPAGGVGYGGYGGGGGSGGAYAGYQKTYSGAAPKAAAGSRAPGYGGARAGGYSNSGYGGGSGSAPREAPTRAAGYGASMAGRSVIGTSAYNAGASAAASRGGYARAAPAPAGGSSGYGRGGSTSGTRYY